MSNTINQHNYLELLSTWSIGKPLSDVMDMSSDDMIREFECRYCGDNLMAQMNVFVSILSQYLEDSHLSKSEKSRLRATISSLRNYIDMKKD